MILKCLFYLGFKKSIAVKAAKLRLSKDDPFITE